MTEAEAHKFLSYWTRRFTWARQLPDREAISRIMWSCINLMISATGFLLLFFSSRLKEPVYQNICAIAFWFLINGSCSWILYRLWQAHRALNYATAGSEK
jgi:hypothetical protein